MDPMRFLRLTDDEERWMTGLVASAASELRHKERDDLAVLIHNYIARLI